MRKSRAWLVIGSLTTVAFIFLAISVKLEPAWLQNIDTTTQYLIAPKVKPTTTKIISLIALLGSPVLAICWTIIIALLIWLKEHRLTHAAWLIFTQLSGCSAVVIIKEIIHRFRPTKEVIPDSGFSFPSGHTFATAIVVLAILCLIVPWLQDQEIQFTTVLLANGWLILIAFTRLYLRAHFFSDICGSFLFALSWWEFSRLLYFKFIQSKQSAAVSDTVSP